MKSDYDRSKVRVFATLLRGPRRVPWLRRLFTGFGACGGGIDDFMNGGHHNQGCNFIFGNCGYSSWMFQIFALAHAVSGAPNSSLNYEKRVVSCNWDTLKKNGVAVGLGVASLGADGWGPKNSMPSWQSDLRFQPER